MKSRQTSTRAYRVALGIGCILFILGLISSPGFVAHTVSPDGILDTDTSKALRALQIVCFLSGVLAIGLRRRVDITRPLTYFASRNPNWFAACIGASASIVILTVFELAFWVANTHRVERAEYRYSNGDIHQYDPDLGYKPIPNHTTTIDFSYDKRLINSTTYTFDAWGRRGTSQPDGAPKPNKSILVFGCSFAFGSCVQDDETVAARIGQLAPGFRVYNYAYGGFGTQHMLATLQRPDLEQEIEVPPRIALYFFIPNHVRRAYGSMIVLTRWGEYFPFYRLNAAGVPERKGSFHTADALRVSLYQFLAREQFMKYFKLDFPLRVTNAQIDYTARLIQESQRAFAQRFGSREFYVVLWPEHPSDDFDTQAIIPFLERAGIRYLDYTQMREGKDFGALTPYVLHPAAPLHTAVGKHIVTDLELVE